MNRLRCWRRFAPVLALAGLAAAAPAAGQATKAAPAPTPPRQGYSIFRETLVDLPWPEVKKLAEARPIVLVPIGVIEEHGPHLSLGADTYLTYEVSVGIKHRLGERGIPAVITPPMYWGVMQLEETGAYPGSFTVRPATMQAVLYDVLSDLKRWGFRDVVLMNLHGDRVHNGVIAQVTTLARDSLGLRFFDPRAYPWPRQDPRKLYHGEKSPFQPDYHAGMNETAEMLAYFPEEVDVKVAATLPPEKGFHPRGYAGDPANYTNFDGRALDGFMDGIASSIATWAKDPAR